MPYEKISANTPCPKCGGKTYAEDSYGLAKPIFGAFVARRRRKCTNCSARISTIEINQDALERAIKRLQAFEQAYENMQAVAKLLSDGEG